MINFSHFFQLAFAVFFKIVASLCQCPGNEGKVCNRILPAMDEDPHSFCTNYIGKECSTDDYCGDCYDRTNDMWSKVSA